MSDGPDPIREHLEMAEEIDRMERDVTSWEADFLDSILKRLRNKIPLTPKQAEVLEGMHEKYIWEKERFDEQAEKGD